MPEVVTGSYNPVTGERRTYRQQYTVPPPEWNGPSPEQVAKLYRDQKIDEASKVVAAAIQFQGMRGYQEALKKGDLAEKALARYGPMMFYSKPSAIAPTMKALTPPQINPNQAAALEFRKQQAALPQKPFYRSGERGSVNKINPVDDSYKTIVPGAPPKPPTDYAAIEDRKMLAEKYRNASSELEEIGPRKEGFFGGNVGKFTEAEKKRDEARAALRGTASGTTPTPLSEQAARTAPPMPKSKAELKRGERYLTPRGEATWDGEKFVQ